MARTQVDGDQVLDGSIQKKDLDITTSGQSVITQVEVAGGLEIVSHTGVDSGTGVVTLRSAGGFGTQFHSFSATAEQTATGSSWAQAALFVVTGLESGKYIVHYKAQITNTSKKTTGYQVNYRLNGGAYNILDESFNAPTTANIYETRGAFEEITIPTSGTTIDIQTNFGQTTAGGTAKIKNIAVYIFKVGDI